MGRRERMKNKIIDDNNLQMLKRIIGLIIVAILIVSSVFLNDLIINNREFILPTSQPRLMSLTVVHLLMMGYVAVFIHVDQVQQAIKWGLLLSLSIMGIIAITEIYIYKRRFQFIGLSGHYAFSQPLEIIYLNIYFILFMLSLIGSFTLSIATLIICCHQLIRQRRIRKSLQKNVKNIQFTQQLNGEDCPICLSPFVGEQKISKIRCQHIFHTACLYEWIKVNNTCPNCRLNFFEQFNQQQIVQARQNM